MNLNYLILIPGQATSFYVYFKLIFSLNCNFKNLSIHHSAINSEICSKFQQNVFRLSDPMLKLHKSCHYICNHSQYIPILRPNLQNKLNYLSLNRSKWDLFPRSAPFSFVLCLTSYISCSFYI